MQKIFEGNVVFSKKGRDKGHMFVVLLSLDDDFVLVCDGDRRKVEKPKRKRRKHLSATPHQAPEIISLYAMNRLKDSDVRKALKPFYVDEAASMGQAGHSSQVKENDAGNHATEQNKEGHPIV